MRVLPPCDCYLWEFSTIRFYIITCRYGLKTNEYKKTGQVHQLRWHISYLLVNKLFCYNKSFYTKAMIRRNHYISFFFMTQQPPVCEGLLIVEVSRSHSDPPHSVALLWTSDQPGAETSTWQKSLTRDRDRLYKSIPSKNLKSHHFK
jgi:hypothetical protein